MLQPSQAIASKLSTRHKAPTNSRQAIRKLSFVPPLRIELRTRT